MRNGAYASVDCSLTVADVKAQVEAELRPSAATTSRGSGIRSSPVSAVLHFDTLPESTAELLTRLQNLDEVSGFTLIGGTALALQVRHRISEADEVGVLPPIFHRRRKTALPASRT
jgi:hypothetical protein